MRRLANDPRMTFSAADLVAVVYPDDSPASPTPKLWAYTNTGYILAQMIIERASGNAYTDEITRRFLDDPRLGLSQTHYAPDVYPPDVRERLVAGYFFNTSPSNAALAPLLGKDVRDDSLSWAQGAGGIVATPQDLTHWVRALYQGDLLAAAQRAELLSLVSTKSGQPIAVTSAADPAGFGLGVAQRTSKFGTWWYYEGMTLGYRVLYAWIPTSDLVIALALNSQPPDGQDKIGTLLETVYTTLRAAGRT